MIGRLLVRMTVTVADVLLVPPGPVTVSCTRACFCVFTGRNDVGYVCVVMALAVVLFVPSPQFHEY